MSNHPYLRIVDDDNAALALALKSQDTIEDKDGLCPASFDGDDFNSNGNGVVVVKFKGSAVAESDGDAGDDEPPPPQRTRPLHPQIHPPHPRHRLRIGTYPPHTSGLRYRHLCRVRRQADSGTGHMYQGRCGTALDGKCGEFGDAAPEIYGRYATSQRN